MKRLLLCSGVYGKKAAIEGLRRLATDRRPEAILFAGGILSSQRRAVPCSTGLWGLTPEDERFAIEFGAALGALGVFSAVIQEPNFVPEDQFCRLAMAVELEFPNVHVAHATVVETHDLAVCGLGIAIAEQALMREDSYSRVRAQYFLRALGSSGKPRKVLLLPEPPPGRLGGQEGNVIVGDLIDWLRPSLCVVAGSTERRGLQRIASTLIVNPGHLADGSAAWLDWSRGDEVEFLECNSGAVIRENSP
jgi:Icc-related predicted phosphoesterase